MSNIDAPMVEAVLVGLRHEVKRRRLVFVQTNPLLNECLKQENVESRFAYLPCLEVANSATEPPERPLLITGVDDFVLDSHDPATALGVLRARINQLLDEGADLCLVSAAPRIAFPDCPGSDVLDDAHPYRVDSSSDLEAQEVCSICWQSPVSLDALVDTLGTLGADVCSLLDVLLFEMQETRAVSEALATDREWEALRLAGLMTVDAGGRSMSLALGPAVLAPALSEAISQRQEVQEQFYDVVRDLVRIERGLRRALRVRAIEEFGAKWRGQVLFQATSDEAVKRAASELRTSVPSVKSLRDPFEWVTLGELVDVIRTRTWADRLGQSDEYWRSFAGEVLPIRNRVGHMRLLRRTDRQTVTYWTNRLARAVSA